MCCDESYDLDELEIEEELEKEDGDLCCDFCGELTPLEELDNFEGFLICEMCAAAAEDIEECECADCCDYDCRADRYVEHYDETEDEEEDEFADEDDEDEDDPCSGCFCEACAGDECGYGCCDCPCDAVEGC